MTMEEYFGEWLRIIDKNELYNVMNILDREYKTKPICPLKSDVFKAFNLCPLSSLRIIMLGQDPYPDKFEGQPRATGILFGNRKETKTSDWSPSLKVIHKAATPEEQYGISFDHTLESWAKQGVLMLNSALTCQLGKVGSHTMLWRRFISKLLENLSDYSSGLIYVLFGSQAKTFKPYINKKFNYIYEIEHPAFFARMNKEMPSTLFIDVKKKAEELNNIPINWFTNY